MTAPGGNARSERPAVFFLSYARGVARGGIESGYEPDRYVLELYEELSTYVAELVGRLPGWAPGFMDGSAVSSQRWRPVLPRAVREVQFFSPLPLPDLDFAAQYHQEGVIGLRQLGLHRTYKAIERRLAQRIVAISRAHQVEPLDDRRITPDELRNIFEGEV